MNRSDSMSYHYFGKCVDRYVYKKQHSLANWNIWGIILTKKVEKCLLLRFTYSGCKYSIKMQNFEQNLIFWVHRNHLTFVWRNSKYLSLATHFERSDLIKSVRGWFYSSTLPHKVFNFPHKNINKFWPRF